MKTVRKSFGAGLLVLLVLLMIIQPVTAGSPGSYSLVDDLGTEVVLEEKPERIISLNPAMTEILFALDLGAEVVGVTTYADYPAEALEKEKIGTIVDPNIEKIITLEPDLILAINVNKIEVVEQFRNLGFKVAGFDPLTVEDVFETISRVGRITGKSERAEELVIGLSSEMSRMKALVEEALKERERPRVFFEIWNDPLYTAGDNTFIDNLIELAGGVNIGAEALGDWPQYSMEKLLIENPDIYIAGPHTAEGVADVETIKARENYENIKAVSNNRVYIIDPDLVSRTTPRIIEGLKEFIKAFFPELKAEVEG